MYKLYEIVDDWTPYTEYGLVLRSTHPTLQHAIDGCGISLSEMNGHWESDCGSWFIVAEGLEEEDIYSLYNTITNNTVWDRIERCYL